MSPSNCWPEFVDRGRELGGTGRIAGVALTQQGLGEADHRVQRRAQLVAHGGEEARLRLVGRLGRLLGPAQLPSRGLQFRHIRIGQHRAAIRGRVGSHLDDAPGPGRPPIEFRLGGSVGARPTLHERLGRRALAELARRRQAVEDLLLASPGCQRLGRQAQQLARHTVGGDQPAVGTEQRDSVPDIGEHQVHVRGAPQQLVLGVRQRRDVGDDADMAAIGQRRGPHVHRGAVGPPPTAHLRAADVVRHLPGVDLVRGARPVLAGRGATADDRVEMIADGQRRPPHDLNVGGIEHRDPTVRPVDADAVRDVVEDAVQHRGPAHCLVLCAGELADVGHTHRPAAVGQRVGGDVRDLAVRANPAHGRRAGPVHAGLGRHERLSCRIGVFVAAVHQVEQVRKRQPGA